MSAADADVVATVDVPEAVPSSDTPPVAGSSDSASSAQRRQSGGRGGGRGGQGGRGGRGGGRGPRPEPTVKQEQIVPDAEFTGVVVNLLVFSMALDRHTLYLHPHSGSRASDMILVETCICSQPHSCTTNCGR